MARILLAKARFTTFDQYTLVPPVGLMYLAAALRRAGHQVRIHDSGCQWRDQDRFRAALAAFRPDIVGLSAITVEAHVMEKLAATTRAALPGVPIVAGGPHATAYPEWCLRVPAIDYVVLGEGEQSLPALVEVLIRGGRPDALAGVASRGPAGEPSFGPPPEPICDLDALAFPAWDLIEIDLYAQHRSMAAMGHRRYMPLVTSRGCPYRCIYCHQVHGKQFRARSPMNVLAELEELHRCHGIRDFEVIDDIFNFDRPRMQEILERVAALKWRPTLHFPNALRADLLDEAQLRWLRKARTLYLSLAVDAATARLQHLIRRNLRLEVVRHNIQSAARHGMFVNGFFMLGFPTETAEEARATVEFAVRSPLHAALFSIVTPFAGTEVYEMARRLSGLRGIPRRFEEFTYSSGTANVSAMTDQQLYGIQREAYLRFYADPRRVLRILWTHPHRWQLFPDGLRALVRMLPHKRWKT
ncbi:MAG: B12-binding domain-containing radical SAM protein [Deltaproteobacteria bacterium]|nr:B12-binding domain-containing radical SAM protein [Deltaproteobacteria bacterium]